MEKPLKMCLPCSWQVVVFCLGSLNGDRSQYSIFSPSGPNVLQPSQVVVGG